MSAQKNGSFELGGTLGYDFGLKSHQGGLFTFQPEIGKYFSDQFYLGVGTGIVTDDKFDSQMLPVFARGEFDFPVTEKLTPFFLYKQVTTLVHMQMVVYVSILQ